MSKFNNIISTTGLLRFGVAFVFLLLVAAAQIAAAQPSATINYQGKLTDGSGVAVADGTYNMRFWLIDSDVAATTTAVWTESLTSTNQVQVINGLFSVMLGSTTPLTGVDFNQTLYLGVEIGGTGGVVWDGEMSPRKPLGTVPAAFEAFQLGGVASSSFLRSDQADSMDAFLTLTGGASTTDITISGTATTTNLVVGSDYISDLTGVGLIVSGNALSVSTSSLNLDIADTLGTLAATRGGTGLSTVTEDQLMIGGPGNTWTQVATSALGFSSQTLTLGTDNQIPFTNAGGTDLDYSDKFIFDGTNLAIGTTTPNALLTVAGDIGIDNDTFLIKYGTNKFIVASSSNQSTHIGLRAGRDDTGSGNTYVGDFAAGAQTSNSYNTAVGVESGYENTRDYSDFFGYNSGRYAVSSGTVALGSYSLFGAQYFPYYADNNTAIGFKSGFSVEDGANNNILLGYQAADSLTTGANNIIIGYDVEAPSNTGSNQLNIGNAIFGTGLSATGTDVATDSTIFIGTTTLPRYATNTQFAIGGGKTIITQSTPVKLTEADVANDGAYDIAIKGNYAYTVSFSGADEEIEIYNISNASSSVKVGGIDTLNTVWNLEVVGNYLYANINGNGLYIYDVSDPANPFVVSGTGSDTYSDIEVVGNYVYMSTSLLDDLVVFDVSDPFNIDTVSTTDLGSGARSLEFYGQYLYMGTASTSEDFDVYDVSDPTSPQRVGGVNISAGSIQGLEIRGNYAYVAGSSPDMLAIIDVSDPRNPVLVSSTVTADGAEDVTLSGRYAYVGEWSSTGDEIEIFDISDPYNPLKVGSIDSDSSDSALAVYGNRLFTGGDLVSFDLGGFEAPSAEIGTILADRIYTEDLFSGSGRINSDLTVGNNTLINGMLSISGTASSTRQSSNTNPSLLVTSGYVGIGTTTPNYKLSVAGSMGVTGALYDNSYSAGSNGYVLQSNGAGFNWVATSTLGFSGGASDFLSLSDTPGSFTANRIPFTNSGGTALTDSAGLTFDGATLAVTGSTTISNILNVSGSATSTFSGPVALGDVLKFNSDDPTMFSSESTYGDTPFLKISSPWLVGQGTTLLGANAFAQSHAGGSYNTRNNTAIGASSLATLVTGANNTAIGKGAMDGTVYGHENVAVGANSGNDNGDYNVAIGFNTMSGNTGTGTIAIGYSAGDAIANLDIDRSIIIGYDVEFASDTADDQLNIGNLIFGTNVDGTGTTLSSGNIGIGTSSPASKLDVWGDFRVGTSSASSLFVDAGADQVMLGTSTAFTTASSVVGVPKLYLEDGGIALRNSTILNRESLIEQDNNGYLNLFTSTYFDTFVGGYADTGFVSRMSSTGAIFNPTAQAGIDFTILGDTDPNLFFADAGNDTIGISTSTATQTFTVDGSTYLTGALYDNANSAGGNGYVLQSDGSGFAWVATSTLGLGGDAETNSLETTITGIADTEIFIGNGADSGTFATVSGDATLANNGALTLAASNGNLTTLSNVTTVGALNAGSIASGFGAIDNGTSNITTGGLLTIDVDGAAIGAAGSLTLGAGNDSALYWNGTNLELDTSSGIDFSINGTPEADLAADGFNLITGDSYQINNTSVLNATTLGTGVINSSLTSVGTISAGVWQGTAVADTYVADDLTISSSGTIDPQAITLAAGSILFGDGANNALATSSLFIATSGNIGIGTTTPESLLHLENTGLTGSINAGIKKDIGLLNSTLDAVQYGDRSYITIDSTATSTVVGGIVRIEDNTTLGNTVRGFEVQANKAGNTQGENTALSGFARTFGVRGYSSGDAGSVFEPAGGFFETGGSSLGNAIRGYSSSITTAELLSLYQEDSAFTGTGLLMNFGNDTGSFSSTSSKFVDFQNAGTSKFTVTAHGTTTIGDGTTNNMAGLQIGYGGLCVDNDGSCNASTTGRISSVSSYLGNSDLAEMYFSSENLEPGEIVVADEFISIKRATGENGKVLGVVSTKPGLLLGSDDTPIQTGAGYPLALSGRVPVKLSTENGLIQVGDPLTLSSIPGIAMKATDADEIVGYALESFDGTYAYTDGYVNQFGDDIAEPNYDAINVNTEAQNTAGCYFGGGGATGATSTTECDPEDVSTYEGPTKDEIAAARYEAMQEALDGLRNKPAAVQFVDEEEVFIGNVTMFVDRGHHFTDEQLDVLNELTSSSTELVLGVETDSGETLWSRLKELAQGFVGGVLTIGGLAADLVQSEKIETNELCIDGVCVTADDLRILLEGSDSDTQITDVDDGGSTVDDGEVSEVDNETGTTTSTDTATSTDEIGDDTASSTDEVVLDDGIASSTPEQAGSGSEENSVGEGSNQEGVTGEGEETDGMSESDEVEPQIDSGITEEIEENESDSKPEESSAEEQDQESETETSEEEVTDELVI